VENVVDLKELVAQEIADYVAIGIHNADTYFMRDDVKRIYAFIAVDRKLPTNSDVVMLARITDKNQVIIETDLTDKPLYKSLIDLGVPRSQIIRAYVGKTEPEL